MASSSSSSGGAGFTSLLALTFIILKLCGVIDWSWWWVLSPFWISAGILFSVLSLLGVIALVAALATGRSHKVSVRRRR